MTTELDRRVQRAFELVGGFRIDTATHRHYMPALARLLRQLDHFGSILRVIVSSFPLAERW